MPQVWVKSLATQVYQGQRSQSACESSSIHPGLSRSTIEGKRVLTAAVDSQALDQARYNWRKQGIALLDAYFARRCRREIAQTNGRIPFKLWGA